ncbi:unnamed protein product [Tilletia caries]|nr:unnamed protein product [Tilletia caries]
MGKEQSRIVDRSKPSPASIRLDVPVAVQATAHGSPSLLLSSSVAFGIGHVAASVTRRAPATIARTDSTGVSARSLAASCEQHASLAPAVQPHMAPVKPRPKALQWKSLSAKAKRDSIRSFHLRPARQDIAFGSLFPDYDPQSTTSNSRVVRAARTKKAPDKLSLGLVQSTNTSLSSARISPSMSFTPLDPTGSGPPPLEGNRPTSPPDGSPNPSAWPYGGDHSTARGGRVSVDELGRRVVAKLHHTDIEQSRIIHLLDIGVLKLSSPEQTCTGGPAMQQQQAGVSPTSPKIGQDSQDVEQAAGPDSARAGINSVRKDNGHLLCVPTRDSIVTTVRQLITRMQHDPGTDSSDADTDIPLRLWRSQR